MKYFPELASVLKNKGLHISAAESCTGGMFISSLIDVPGISSVVDVSFVVYSPDAKSRFVGVPPETITEFGLVSEETARAMAKGVCETSGAEIGVGITGNAGPSVCEADTSAGVVCFGFCVKGKLMTCTRRFDASDRNSVRKAACEFAAGKLIEILDRG